MITGIGTPNNHNRIPRPIVFPFFAVAATQFTSDSLNGVEPRMFPMPTPPLQRTAPYIKLLHLRQDARASPPFSVG